MGSSGLDTNFTRSVHLVSLLLLAVFAGVHGRHGFSDSSVDFYTKECPAARRLVASTVRSAIRKDRGIAAALLRLHFHDCFVRISHKPPIPLIAYLLWGIHAWWNRKALISLKGCDASILLDGANGTQAEKDSFVNANSIRGYEVIDSIKAVVEKFCPGKVSCSDIVTLAARDAIVQVTDVLIAKVEQQLAELDEDTTEAVGVVNEAELIPGLPDHLVVVHIVPRCCEPTELWRLRRVCHRWKHVIGESTAWAGLEALRAGDSCYRRACFEQGVFRESLSIRLQREVELIAECACYPLEMYRLEDECQVASVSRSI
ncbi:hypothetical protein R1sor_009387 [Riccia sorocarpa]|uniref:Peroxidase n=1 Tax=Riccia sorocarpa TaxID=122646 RepID=A0ABD3HWJ2_9MARC